MEILKERPGIRVYKTDHNTVVKETTDGSKREAIHRCWRFLMALSDTPYVPQPTKKEHNKIEMEYVTESPLDDPIEFQEQLRFNMTRVLFTLQQRGIRHGDLTRPNFIIDGAIPKVIDWDQSNFVFDTKRQKRPEEDYYHFYRTFPHIVPDTNRVMRRWLAIREEIDDFRGWGRLIDLGTHQGSFVSLAQSEYIQSTGIDSGQIRGDGIKTASERWGKYGCQFIDANIVDFDVKGYNIALLFSTWAYIVQDYGRDVALQTLARIIRDVDVLFFETQLYGDGPGPEFLNTKEDTRHMLETYARHVKEVVTIDVVGRPAKRTVWRVSK